MESNLSPHNEPTGNESAEVWALEGRIAESKPFEKHFIKNWPYEIGRSEDCHLKIDLSGISRSHARLQFDGNGLFVTDLNSRNGTYVNGQKISEQHPLQPGDIVQFATCPFRVSVTMQGNCTATDSGMDTDRSFTLFQFQRMLRQKLAETYFEPITKLADGMQTVIGYSAGIRSRLAGLRTPRQMFQAASALDMAPDLARWLRMTIVESAAEIPGEPIIFVECSDDETASLSITHTLAEIREHFSRQNLVVQISSRASLRLSQPETVRQELDNLRVELAFTDFSGDEKELTPLMAFKPKYIRFSSRLFTGLTRAESAHCEKLQLTVARLSLSGIRSIASGIESLGDADCCRAMGFEYGLGPWFGRPSSLARMLTELAADDESLSYEHST